MVQRISGAAKASTAGVFVLALAALPILWSEDRRDLTDAAPALATGADTSDASTEAEPRAPASLRPASLVPAAEERAVYLEAAEAAYGYLVANRAGSTGLVKATENYDHITTWDIGSLILGLYSASELGVADRAETVAWLEQILRTLGEVPLFDDAAYNKSYAASTARPIGTNDRPSSTGKGWSSTDLGRLLIALKVVEQVPELAASARAAASRIDFARVVRDGYLHGEEPRRSGIISYQEGRLGYEQYAAQGFALWGRPAEAALDLSAHGVPMTVEGQRILRDDRGNELLTSEPFVLMGMEVGWAPEVGELANAILDLQRARYESTGQVTIVSEDAIEHPPHYFYYYSVWSDGSPFVVGTHDRQVQGPRWVSAKAAYAWHALVPDSYTWRAVRAVEPARSAAGWASGIYEGSGRSTGVENLNTAAVILEAALYRERGRPMLELARAGS